MQRREEVNINVHRERGEDVEPEMISDDEYRAGQIGGSAGNYYTDRIITMGSMGERWAGRG
ncbi:Coupling protein TraD [Escherichia coli]|uniref:Coupling protein TraD n=1 Tax=Escherichia coli TaxID=562 RepID=A0A3P5HCI7_ECOLX|nr:Coupling protein TraD [Escherichia coli]